MQSYWLGQKSNFLNATLSPPRLWCECAIDFCSGQSVKHYAIAHVFLDYKEQMRSVQADRLRGDGAANWKRLAHEAQTENSRKKSRVRKADL